MIELPWEEEMSVLPKSRKEAILTGARRFFTGLPCCRGHVAPRNIQGSCMLCQRLHTKNWQSKNKAAIRDYGIKYTKANKDKIAEKGRRFRKNHPGYWRNTSREIARKYERTYQEKNPEAIRAKWQRRATRRQQAEGYFKKEDILEIMKQQNAKCAYCRKSISKKYDIDHITPLARGGTSFRSNLQLLCPTCNRRKSDKDPIAFAQSRGLLI